MKFIKGFFKNFVMRSDMFAAQPTLRFNGQPAYETMFGGCLSIILVLAFAVIFGKSFINVLEKVNVSATLNIEDNPYDSNQISGVKMAIGIEGLDFSTDKRYFNLILTQNTMVKGRPTHKQIQLSPCQYQDWQGLGQKFDLLFQVYGMSKMLCPVETEDLTLSGFAGNDPWVTMNFLVQQCGNGTSSSWSCYSPTETRDLFTTHFQTNDFFKVNFLVMNTIISPQQQNSTKIVLQNEIFLTFSNVSGSRGEIKLARYEIETDNSIWPVSDTTTEQGYYISDKSTYTIGLYSTHYVRIEIEKSRSIYQVSRSHDKFDEMLSYVGGLFALLFGWIFFFIGSYNEYRYEISVAENAFVMNETGVKVKQDHFGFWTYLKYTLYDWMLTFNIPIRWQRMQEIHSAREQACQQMDVKYLMKKIQRYEAVNTFLLGEHNLILSNLSRPPTLDQVKKMRKITQYYDKVIKTQSQEAMLAHIMKATQEDQLGNIFKSNLVGNEDSAISIIKQLEKKQQPAQQEEVDLDSEDQEIQKQIFEIYKKCSKEQSDQATIQLIGHIPQSLKDRFSKLEIKYKEDQKNKQDLASKVKIQSNFSINQSVDTPKIFNQVLFKAKN